MGEDEFSELSQSFQPVQSLDQRPSPFQFKAPSMVFIRDSPNSFVFPPVNHENLQISPHFDPEETDPSSTSPSSSSLSSSSSFSHSDVKWVDASPPPPLDTLAPPAFDSRVRKSGQISSWFAIGLDVLYSRAVRFASSFQNYATGRGSIWSFAPWAVAAVVLWLYRWLQRRRRGGQNRLIKRIIKEKDEKITQLMHQISRMNELLLARHSLKLGD